MQAREATPPWHIRILLAELQMTSPASAHRHRRRGGQVIAPNQRALWIFSRMSREASSPC
jgi:hypothetical protein